MSASVASLPSSASLSLPPRWRLSFRHSGLGQTPRRSGLTGAALLSAPAGGCLVGDFLTLATIRLKSFSVLFALELCRRRVHLLGVRLNPHSAWMTQEARNLAIGGRLAEIRFLRHDRDAQFCAPFAELFGTQAARGIETPMRAPKANACAERWLETLPRESLDHLLICGRRQLEVVLRSYVRHDNAARPQRGIGLERPDGRRPLGSPPATMVRRCDLLGGLIHEYALAA